MNCSVFRFFDLLPFFTWVKLWSDNVKMKKMFVIAVYDDNEAAMKSLTQIIDSCLATKDCKATYHLFKDFDSLSEILDGKSGFSCDMFFMDIELDGGISGIELATRLAAVIDSLKIVFMTGYGSRYSQEIFTGSNTFSPVGFLTKPFDEKIIAKLLELRLLDDSENCGDVIEVVCDRKKMSLACSEIAYIESEGRKLKIYLKDDSVVETYCKISEISSLLPDYFLKCHRSYIVNADAVVSIDGKEGRLLLEGGRKIFITRSLKKDFMREFLLRKGGVR